MAESQRTARRTQGVDEHGNSIVRCLPTIQNFTLDCVLWTHRRPAGTAPARTQYVYDSSKLWKFHFAEPFLGRGCNKLGKLVAPKGCGASNFARIRSRKNFRGPEHVVVMPMRDDQEFDGLPDIDIEFAQIFKSNGFVRPGIYTRINYYPLTGAEM